MSGRVFKRGKTWSYVVDVHGGRTNRRQRMKGGFPTKREAQRSLRAVERAIDDNFFVMPTDETVGDFPVTQWLPAMTLPALRAPHGWSTEGMSTHTYFRAWASCHCNR